MFRPEGCIVVIVATAISHNRPTSHNRPVYVLCGDCRPYLPDDDERVDDYEDEGDDSYEDYDNDADDVHRQNNPNDGVVTIYHCLINY